MLLELGAPVHPEALRNRYPALLQAYTNEQVEAALDIIKTNQDGTQADETSVEGDDPETAFRRAEFQALRDERKEKQLMIKRAELGDYAPDIARFFSRIMLLDKLRETRALTGFARVYPENDQDLEKRKAMLWKQPPQGVQSWLPAYKVFGEGIFLELDESLLKRWETNSDVITTRAKRLAEHYEQVKRDKQMRFREVGPRFLLLHTLSHLIMNRLTFECGYSSAALRERLFVSANMEFPMAGILIYTADGDAEGTMGGLVRMGKPGYLEPVIRRALEGAQWCSADPVCMEIGSQGGQGPDSCNLAACHNCALVPETACEEFNRFLDRAVVVGDINNRSIGFFS